MFLKKSKKEDVGNEKPVLKKPKKKAINEVKKISQKKMDMYFWSGFLGLIGLCALTVFLSFTREIRPVKSTEPLNQVEVDYSYVDNRLQEFLGSYITAYFSVPEKSEERPDWEKKVNDYYNFSPSIKGESPVLLPMSIISYRPLSISDGLASYRVTYEVGTEDKQRVTVLFNIPYGGADGSYYVSGLPYYQPVQDFKAKSVDKSEELILSASDNLAEEEKAELIAFLDLFFKNYTTSQDNLDVISEGLRSVNGVEFKSVDYSYFKIGNEVTIAYVQATFSILGVTHKENFTFEIEKRDNGYFVTNLDYSIPADYSK